MCREREDAPVAVEAHFCGQCCSLQEPRSVATSLQAVGGIACMELAALPLWRRMYTSRQRFLARLLQAALLAQQ
jgi:hypothetical protein